MFEAVDRRHHAAQRLAVPAQRSATLRPVGHRQAELPGDQRLGQFGQRLSEPRREQQVQAQRFGPCVAAGAAQQLEGLHGAGAEAALRLRQGQRGPAHLGELRPGARGLVLAVAEGRHPLGQRRVAGEPAFGGIEQQREVVVVHGRCPHMSRIALAMIDFWISLAPA
ncbi:MAG: hypothetical protein QM722_15435 [Piscinibacter sp.]